MLSAYLDMTPLRTGTTRLLGGVSRRAYFGPLAPFRLTQLGRARLPGPRWVRVRNTLAGIADEDVARVCMQVDPRVSVQAAPQPRRSEERRVGKECRSRW